MFAKFLPSGSGLQSSQNRTKNEVKKLMAKITEYLDQYETEESAKLSEN